MGPVEIPLEQSRNPAQPTKIPEPEVMSGRINSGNEITGIGSACAEQPLSLQHVESMVKSVIRREDSRESAGGYKRVFSEEIARYPFPK